MLSGRTVDHEKWQFSKFWMPPGNSKNYTLGIVSPNACRQSTTKKTPNGTDFAHMWGGGGRMCYTEGATRLETLEYVQGPAEASENTADAEIELCDAMR